MSGRHQNCQPRPDLLRWDLPDFAVALAVGFGSVFAAATVGLGMGSELGVQTWGDNFRSARGADDR